MFMANNENGLFTLHLFAGISFRLYPSVFSVSIDFRHGGIFQHNFRNISRKLTKDQFQFDNRQTIFKDH